MRFTREDEGLVVHTLVGDDPADLRALLDAVASVATGPWLAGDDDALSGCGFVRDGDRWVRALAAAPAPAAATRAVTLAQLEDAIRAAWGADTSETPDAWSASNPALGQCGVTALLVREHLGGEILVAGVVRGGLRVERHAWNRLPSGLTIDLTREQFRAGELLEEPEATEPLVTQRHPERLALLRGRVQALLAAA